MQCADHTASTEKLAIADMSVMLARISGATAASTSTRSSRQPLKIAGNQAVPFGPLPKLTKIFCGASLIVPTVLAAAPSYSEARRGREAAATVIRSKSSTTRAAGKCCVASAATAVGS